MLADVNLITPVTGNQPLDRARIKKRGARKHERVDPKPNQQGAHNQTGSEPRSQSGKGRDNSKGLEIYA